MRCLACCRGSSSDLWRRRRYLVLSDWLEENDDPRRAELLRLHRQLLATCCVPDRHPERVGWQARLVELLEQRVQPCWPQQSTTLTYGQALSFAFLPPGSFLMGSPTSEKERFDDETQHRVNLTKGFFLAVTQVTQAQWRAVIGSDPSFFKGDDRPVEQVSWEDCQEFCKRLSQQDGKPYRLPTEAEWEYACRAGTTSPFHFGETISTEQVNYDGNYPYGSGRKGKYRKETTPVGSFPANAWGLHDMHGNVWEWCNDWFGPYPKSDIKDPQGPESGDARVLRGGSWSNGAKYCRAAYRGRVAPGSRDYYIGFRVCFRQD